MPKSTLKKENLPAGVGRVPGWWMELTPHYLLDLEDDEKRRQQEFQEMIFFARMAAEDDEKTRGEWKSNWQGRSANGGSSGSGCDAGLFGGRNFQPGSNGWDPKEWGISENDPDYQSYLSGAKLPQSYIDAMKEYAGRSGIQYDASNLHQTEYGKYGRQAEKPAFTPSWAKKKLRSTGQGSAIRQGVYTDSPNKHLQPKVNAVASKFEGDLAESTDPSSEPATPERVAFVPTQAPVTPTHVTQAHVATTPVYNQPIEHTYTAMPVKMDPRETQPEEEPEQEQDKKFNFKYVATTLRMACIQLLGELIHLTLFDFAFSLQRLLLQRKERHPRA
jgi:hypothetical protein